MSYDIVIKNGTIYDGSGGKPFRSDVGIKGKIISKVDQAINEQADIIIDASGKCITPGFVNMLSWSVESLIEDGRALSGITQGVTLEVMGEGWSWGPLNESTKALFPKLFNTNIKYDISWTTLGEYLEFLEQKGVSVNIASFVGATTVRMNEIGLEDKQASAEQLERMKAQVEEAMKEGAMGLGTSLIYPPAFYAKTKELVELCKVVSKYNGMYISHIRSEGNTIETAIDELIQVSREASLPAEIYHLKMAGKHNWHKFNEVIDKINKAREEGLQITANMYLYTVAGTGLDSCFPPYVLDGGFPKLMELLSDPESRAKIKAEMDINSDEWENLYYASGPEGILIASVQNPDLKKFVSKTILEISTEIKKDPKETIMHLQEVEGGRIGALYSVIDEDNLRKQIPLTYVSFGSDGASISPEGVFLKNNVHPRTYGNVSRLLGKYVRDEKVIPLETAIYKLSHLPCKNLKIKKRGLLKEGYFADINIFNLNLVNDLSTFKEPHQLSEGMDYVLVNGEIVLKDGKHTNKFPGKFVRGPGYTHKK